LVTQLGLTCKMENEGKIWNQFCIQYALEALRWRLQREQRKRQRTNGLREQSRSIDQQTFRRQGLRTPAGPWARIVTFRPHNIVSSGRTRSRARVLDSIAQPDRRWRRQLQFANETSPVTKGCVGGTRKSFVHDVRLRRKPRPPGRCQRRQLQLATDRPRSIATET